MRTRTLCICLAAALAVSCGGGGSKGSPTDSPTPTGPTNSGAPTATGDPSNGDYIELAAEIANMAADQLVQALSGAAVGATARITPLDHLRRPSQNVNRTAAFFCCGRQSANTSHVIVTTAITVPPGTGSLGILQTLGSFPETQWLSTVANGWRIDLSQLRVISEFATSGTTVNASQQLRLFGTLHYTIPNASSKDVNVDVTFRYANLESGTPTATGQIGSATVTDQSTPPLIAPGRCSRPREGCGPLVMGDAPCTVWPKCPGT